MTRRRWTLLVGVVSISLVVMLCVSAPDAGGRPLSEAEVRSIRGLEDACRKCIIYESYQLECLSPFDPATDNYCDFLGCVTGSEGDCGTGTHWSNNWIHEYDVSTEPTWSENLEDDTQLSCSHTRYCVTGTFDEDQNCEDGYWTEEPPVAVLGVGCHFPPPPPIPDPRGCKPCSEGAPDYDSFVSKTDPECVTCPFEPEI